jgi:hypothetical protein
MSLTRTDPPLVSFLVDNAFNEADPVRGAALLSVVHRWRATPGSDGVWRSMSALSRGYSDAPGYRVEWLR